MSSVKELLTVKIFKTIHKVVFKILILRSIKNKTKKEFVKSVEDTIHLQISKAVQKGFVLEVVQTVDLFQRKVKRKKRRLKKFFGGSIQAIQNYLKNFVKFVGVG